MVRLFHVLVAEDLLQRAYNEHLFGVGPLDHDNRSRAEETISVGGSGRRTLRQTRVRTHEVTADATILKNDSVDFELHRFGGGVASPRRILSSSVIQVPTG